MSSENTVSELKAIAKAQGLKGYSGLRKNELIALINSERVRVPKTQPKQLPSPKPQPKQLPSPQPKQLPSPKTLKSSKPIPPPLPKFSPYHFKKQQNPKTPKIPAPPVPQRSEIPVTAISLEFHTHTALIDKKYLVPPVYLNLYFNDNGRYIQDRKITYLQSHAIFHLIKRASGRLALNTTNQFLKDNKTELVSVTINSVDFKGNLEPLETLYLQEIRQYTGTQEIKNTLRAGVAGILAPVAGLKGIITGKLGVVKEPFQQFLGDKYIDIKDKELYSDLYYGSNPKFLEATVPFHLAINNLVFPESIATGEIYTLYLTGEFLRVHLQSKNGEVTHGDTSSLRIQTVRLLNDREDKVEIKKLLKNCKSEDDCIYFEPEI